MRNAKKISAHVMVVACEICVDPVGHNLGSVELFAAVKEQEAPTVQTLEEVHIKSRE